MQTISTALQTAINAGNPQRVLLKFGNNELSNEDILISAGIELDENWNTDEDFAIGNCPSATLRFALLNDNHQLDNFSFGWFSAFLGARIDTGTPTEITRTFTEGGVQKTYAFAPLGIFYCNKPKILAKTSVSITAYDQMMQFERNMPSNTTLGFTYPTDIKTILQKICANRSITLKSSSFLNDDLTVASKPKEFDNATMRQVIGWIAECACSNARFTRDGQLELAWFSSTGKSFSESDYSSFTPAWYETAAINGLYCRNTTNSTETTEGQTKTNNYLILDNPFLK